MARRTAAPTVFLVALILGFAGALAYAWLVAPADTRDATPAQLDRADRAAYLQLVADAYAADGDLAQAGRRISALGAADGPRWLLEALESEARAGDAPRNLQRLAVLARDLGLDGAAVTLLAPPAAVPLTPPPLPTAAPSLAAAPTPGPASGAAYQLVEREQTCDGPTVEIRVEDAAGQPRPGTAIRVIQENGETRLYTGLKPERGPGDADFALDPNTTYAVAIEDEPAVVEDLRAAVCPDGRAGGWRLTLRRAAGGE